MADLTEARARRDADAGGRRVLADQRGKPLLDSAVARPEGVILRVAENGRVIVVVGFVGLAHGLG